MLRTPLLYPTISLLALNLQHEFTAQRIKLFSEEKCSKETSLEGGGPKTVWLTRSHLTRNNRQISVCLWDNIDTLIY